MDPIVIKVPKEMDKMNPINFYLYTNRSLRPLPIKKLIGYREVPQKYGYGPQKEILLDNQNIGRLVEYRETLPSLSDRRRMV
ncbi:unnamed protein product, partial [Iphiclides podalirius]